MPKTLAALAAADLPDQLTFSDVLVSGEVEPGDVLVRAHPEDKALAVEMCRAVFQKCRIMRARSPVANARLIGL